MNISDIVNKYRCIAITGLAKNTGKTSVLNAILSDDSDKIRGITSIGYDGEDIDQVTNTEKPVIYVKKGTFLATADGLLSRCDFTKELLKYTGFNTPMGEVIIVRALSDGYAQIAGPSTRSQMEQTVQYLLEAGAQQIFIDGAASRKSTAAITFSDACILATGAAFSHNIEEIAEETTLFSKLLTLPKASPELLKKSKQVNSIDSNSVDSILSDLNANNSIFFEGAVSTNLLKQLLNAKKTTTELNLIAEDGTRFLTDSATLSQIESKGIALYIKNPINLIAITINPKSPDGTTVNSHQLCQVLSAQIPKVPILDVKSYEFGKN